MAESGTRIAGNLLAMSGDVETPIRWLDDETGMMLKALPDKWLAPVMLDLKTTHDPSGSQFWWTVKKFDYAMQDAHYSDGAKRVHGSDCSFHFIVVQNKKPFAAAMYMLPEDVREDARRRRRKLLMDLADCYVSGIWDDRGAPCAAQQEDAVW